jgi:hypothetical protein
MSFGSTICTAFDPASAALTVDGVPAATSVIGTDQAVPAVAITLSPLLSSLRDCSTARGVTVAAGAASGNFCNTASGACSGGRCRFAHLGLCRGCGKSRSRFACAFALVLAGCLAFFCGGLALAFSAGSTAAECHPARDNRLNAHIQRWVLRPDSRAPRVVWAPNAVASCSLPLTHEPCLPSPAADDDADVCQVLGVLFAVAPLQVFAVAPVSTASASRPSTTIHRSGKVAGSRPRFSHVSR